MFDSETGFEPSPSRGSSSRLQNKTSVLPTLLPKYIKDARSVSLYPYNQSQIFQYVKNTK